jgi:hypothetical protein
VAVDGCGEVTSNVWKDIKVFIILVFAPFSLTKNFFRLNGFKAFNPFHYFVAKLVFSTQSKRSTIHFR